MKCIPFFLLFTLLAIYSSYSQTDSVTVTRSTKDSIDAKYDRIYRLFIMDKKEVRHLWKLNLLDVKVLSPHIYFEQKLGQSFTTESFIRGGMYTNGYNSELDYFTAGFQLSQQLKYYYNLKRRERMGKTTNGFSGNYFSVKPFYSYTDYYFDSDKKGFWKNNQKYGFSIYYGIQRRIGNIGYVEAFAGYSSAYTINSSLQEQYIDLGIKAGFAIDSFKTIKKPH